MIGIRQRLARLGPAAVVIVAVGFAACADQSLPTSPARLTPAPRGPAFNVIGTTSGEVSVCPEGPAGTYSYGISVTIPPNWTNGTLTGTYSAADIALASDAAHQTPVVSPYVFTIPASNSGASCQLVFKVLASINYVNSNGGTQDPIRLVTITQLSAPAGTQLDQIVSTTGGATDVVTLPPAVTVTVDPNFFHGAVAAFWNSVPSNCAVVENALGAARSGSFALLALNSGSMIINSSTSIVGNVGYSALVTSTTNQKITTFIGTSYVHSTANFVYTAATYKPTGGIITGGAADVLLNQANTNVASASAYFAGLPSNGSLGNVTGNLTLSAAGGITVLDASSWDYNSDKLTLNGTASSVFVFRVTGSFDWSQSQIVLNGGVQAANIVWYFPNASAIDINKASNVFAGTIVAPTGSVIYHNPATFNGAIIAKSIAVHSDFNINFPGCK